jgi:hypothetical protein
VGGDSWTNDVPYIYRICTLISQKDQVQQPAILPNINGNQNSRHMHIFNTHTNIQQKKRLCTKKTVGKVSRTNVVPYIEYVLSFFENDEVQQPVILTNINENQNPSHMHNYFQYPH